MASIETPKRLVGCELINFAAQEPSAFANLCEQSYQIRVETAAKQIIESGRPIVMLTGPSATGKTTSAHRLCEAITALGHRSVVLSLDDFFVGEGRYPKRPDGKDDYERVEALDLPILHHCLRELAQTGCCQAPEFDFITQRPKAATRFVDCRGGVAIVEGLHAFNPLLIETLPADVVLNLYASLREEYVGADGRRIIATRDIRLARRIIRDALFRGHDADFTLELWPHVCHAEQGCIRAFKNRADLVLDTSFSYELGLWEPLLSAATAPRHAAKLAQLRARFAALTPIPLQVVPQGSMLREFTGDK